VTAGSIALLVVADVVGAPDDTESGILGVVADVGLPARSKVESQEARHTAASNTITTRGTTLRRSNVEFGSLPGARPECPHLDRHRKRRSAAIPVIWRRRCHLVNLRSSRLPFT
jgi:hypothetical protein